MSQRLSVSMLSVMILIEDNCHARDYNRFFRLIRMTFEVRKYIQDTTWKELCQKLSSKNYSNNVVQTARLSF